MMKSAYELAMERLNQKSPPLKLTAEQKKAIAKLEKETKSRIDELDFNKQAEMDTAAAKMDFAKMAETEARFLAEKAKLEAELEEKREAIRSRKK